MSRIILWDYLFNKSYFEPIDKAELFLQKGGLPVKKLFNPFIFSARSEERAGISNQIHGHMLAMSLIESGIYLLLHI